MIFLNAIYVESLIYIVAKWNFLFILLWSTRKSGVRQKKENGPKIDKVAIATID